MDHITIEGHDGTFAAYIARPKTSPAPAVVVLQEGFGVNAGIRKHCDELAERGFLALAPDLFWRQEPGVNLNVTSEADWQYGLRLYGAYNRDTGVNDIKDTIDAVRDLPECNGKVVLLGDSVRNNCYGSNESPVVRCQFEHPCIPLLNFCPKLL